MTLNVGMRDVISAHVVGDAKKNFRNRFLFLENLYIVPKIKRNLISVSSLIDQQLYPVTFSLNEVFISKNSLYICRLSYWKQLVCIKRPNEAKVVLNHEMFKTANT